MLKPAIADASQSPDEQSEVTRGGVATLIAPSEYLEVVVTRR